MRYLGAATLGLVIAIGPVAHAKPSPVTRGDLCAVPAAILADAPKLLAVRAALASGQTVAILAVGSERTTAPDQSYPHVMLRGLQTALPTARFNLIVAGGRGLTTEELVPHLQAALVAGRPQLVLWQTGTVDAVRGVAPEDMSAAIEDGAALVAASGAELVLIDPKFSHFLVSNTYLDAYEAVLGQAAATLPDTSLFPRFQLMQGWSDGGALDVEDAPAGRRPGVARRMRACVGRALARYVLAGVNRAGGARVPE